MLQESEESEDKEPFTCNFAGFCPIQSETDTVDLESSSNVNLCANQSVNFNNQCKIVKSNEQSGPEIKKRDDLTIASDTATSHKDESKSLNLDLDIVNPTPNIQQHSDVNVVNEQEFAGTIDFISEILTGVRSRNSKLYDYKVKLKDLVGKIDKMTTSTYTILEDDKSSEENMIFVNEIKDTGNYLIKMGQTLLDRGNAMQVVDSSLPHSEQGEALSKEDDVTYISSKHIKSEIKEESDNSTRQPIPFKKEKSTSRIILFI